MRAGKLNLEESQSNLREPVRSANLCQLMWPHWEKAAPSSKPAMDRLSGSFGQERRRGPLLAPSDYRMAISAPSQHSAREIGYLIEPRLVQDGDGLRGAPA